VIVDPETKLIVSLVVGRRNADTVVQVFTDFYERTDGYLPELITTDGYAVYETVILDTYGVLARGTGTDQGGRGRVRAYWDGRVLLPCGDHLRQSPEGTSGGPRGEGEQ